MRWNLIDTSRTCTTKCPMTRHRMSMILSTLRCNFDPFRRQSQLQAHIFERRGQLASSLKKTMLFGIFMRYAVRAGRGWSADLLVAECEDLEHLSAFDIHVKGFKHQEVAQEGQLLFPYADISQTLRSSSTSTRRKARREEKNISMCAKIYQTLRSSSPPTRRNARQGKPCVR